MKKVLTVVAAAVFAVAAAHVSESQACTRLVYLGPDNTVLTGRSMDFSIDIPANLWIFPRGMERRGMVGPNSIQWTSKYGSVAASSWDISTPDGMNEKGLVANMLWLVASEYPVFDPEGEQSGLTISAWGQYALDNFATVAEAVEFFTDVPFAIVSDFIPGTDKFTTVHLSLSDASGDSAIFEYIDGQLEIHHSRDYQVMTNDPPFAEQLAIKSYWETVPGKAFLPGTGKAADRFVRASYYLNMIPQTNDPKIAAASVLSVVRNVSVPYGIGTPDEPHLSNTRWRVVADQGNLIYYFENVLTPNTVWVDFAKVDFSVGADVKKLALDSEQIYAGESSAYFVATEPFQFQGLE
ncbi:MAG: linear amide C-N hydrolase [Gammaproteobacteria bacterium]|nr:linear amide C-N hydrolase [Gammaproteobacteria bacterium]